jgi:hypothetical protein
MTFRNGRPVANSILRHQRRGMGQDAPGITSQDWIDLASAAQPTVSAAPDNATITALQQQVNATADVVGGILSGQYTGTAAGLPAPATTSSTAMLILFAGGALVLLFAMKD